MNVTPGDVFPMPQKSEAPGAAGASWKACGGASDEEVEQQALQGLTGSFRQSSGEFPGKF
ncbi:hypothetical protein LJR168_003464 [Pseudoxanthomonas sp. LjRoot168]|uniref:hypothetical protein n=1 Tax=unclassified Pseudoxanthomonas TaxID=2645906 RepID=UPI0026358910|nr:hypothetical protein [uncultured Pseudoxanthomonas sp.]